MATSTHPFAPEPEPVWVVSLGLAATIELPVIGVVPRAAFLEWTWEALADCQLLGVFEGEASVGDAAALGLESSECVIDAEAAPPDRDWVAGLPATTAACWFATEPAAREAARRLTGMAGCTVEGVSRIAGEQPAAWQDAFAPVDVPGFGWVRPAWDAGVGGFSDGAGTLFIEPGIGFGTGLHPTTQLCLAALAAGPGRRARALDFGSGSGILAIAAALLGLAQVDAVESDRRVHAAIESNAARNGVAGQIRVEAALDPAAGPYDLVVANIVAVVLIEHAPALTAMVRRDATGRIAGQVILSGLLEADLPAVCDCYTPLLGTNPSITVRDGWHCLRWQPTTV